MKDLMMKIPKYLSLFFVSAYVWGFAVYLFRFFAVTTWSEYGIGILAVSLTGFVLGSVSLSLWPNFFGRYRQAFLFWLPFVLLFVSSLAFQLICQNRFNPLLLQNVELWPGQALQILFYYLALFPVFFLAGLYIGLSFLDLSGDLNKACGFHLVGLAAGSLLVIFFESFLHPFILLAALLPVLALAALCRLFVLRYAMFLTGLILLLFMTGFGAWRIIDGNQAAIPDYKPLASAMRVQGNQVVAEIFSREGYYRLLDNAAERHRIDLSDRYGFPKVPERPPALGLYRDGDRITGVCKAGQLESAYFVASLEAFPYLLKPAGKYLLIGTDGGFKIHALWREKRTIRAVEPDRTVYDLVRKGIAGMTGITLTANSPLPVLESKGFDLIDMSADFLKSADANRYSVTVDALCRYFVSLRDGGILSIPVETGGFSGYAIKMLVTVNQSLQRSGVKEPGRHIMIYRSALGARILVSREAFAENDIAALKAFCRERFFDISWYYGMDPDQNEVLHDLPPVMPVVNGTAMKKGATVDALHETALAIFQTPNAVVKETFFNLEPAAFDRPFFYAVYPLKEMLVRPFAVPRPETAQLVNLAVLIQVLPPGVFMMFLPLFGRKAAAADRPTLPFVLYFVCLGLGLILISMALIERSIFFLGDGPDAVALVMAGMLFFAGLGSFRASKFDPLSDQGIKWAVPRIMICLVLYIFLLIPVLSLLISLAPVIKAAVVLLVVAPAAYAVGPLLPLGLTILRERMGHLLPWALGTYVISGIIAFSLAGMLSVVWGIHVLFFVAFFSYFIVFWIYPGRGPVQCATTSGP